MITVGEGRQGADQSQKTLDCEERRVTRPAHVRYSTWREAVLVGVDRLTGTGFARRVPVSVNPTVGQQRNLVTPSGN